MTKAAEETVGIARPNAIHVHIASEFGLLLVSNATASVTTIPGGITAQVNLGAEGPHFTKGEAYRVGGILIDKAQPFSIPKAVFEGYGVGTLAHVAIFKGEVVGPK
jgi:hypothetical protein